MNRQTVSPAAIEQREVTILLKGHLLNVHTITAVGPRREKAVVRSGFNVRIGVIICLVRSVGEDLKPQNNILTDCALTACMLNHLYLYRRFLRE